MEEKQGEAQEADDQECGCPSASQLPAGAMASPVTEEGVSAADQMQAAPVEEPPRLIIKLPPPTSKESLFPGGSGGEAAVSPSPMTLDSSFVAEDHVQTPECDIASPVTKDKGKRVAGIAALEQKQALPMKKRERYYDESMPIWPLDQLLAQSGKGHFELFHQQASAQVTSQAALIHSHTRFQEEYPSSISEVTAASSAQTTRSIPASLEQMPSVALDKETTTLESVDGSHSDQILQLPNLIFGRPLDDGFRWRELKKRVVYYYRCTILRCPAKKKIEHSFDGVELFTIYGDNEHNHPPTPPKRRANQGVTLPVIYNKSKGNVNLPVNSETGSKDYPEHSNQSTYNTDAGAPCREHQESGHGTQEQLSGSGDVEEVGRAEVRTQLGPSHRTYTKPRGPRVKKSSSKASSCLQTPLAWKRRHH